MKRKTPDVAEKPVGEKRVRSGILPPTSTSTAAATVIGVTTTVKSKDGSTTTTTVRTSGGTTHTTIDGPNGVIKVTERPDGTTISEGPFGRQTVKVGKPSGSNVTTVRGPDGRECTIVKEATHTTTIRKVPSQNFTEVSRQWLRGPDGKVMGGSFFFPEGVPVSGPLFPPDETPTRAKKSRSSTSSASSQSTAQEPTVEVVVYSDGSCLNNGKKSARAGVGVYFGPDDPRNVSEPLEGAQTNQRAEIQAAIRAVQVASETLKYPSKLLIKTDSAYVVKAMTEWIHNWRKTNYAKVKNEGLFRRLDILVQTVPFSVKFEHVAAHAGIEGNEQADRLAKKAAMSSS